MSLLEKLYFVVVYSLLAVVASVAGNYAWAASGPVISIGEEHACAIQNDSSIRCWGLNLSGQSDPPSGAFSQVSTGHYFSCGLRPSGQLECWSSGAENLSGTYTQISAGADHICALRSDKSIVCDSEDSLNPAINAPGGSFLQVSSGTDHSCGLKTDSTVSCWGNNDSGEIDAPKTSGFVYVSAGDNHSCAIYNDGQLVCWGADDDGEASPPAGAFRQVSAGGEHSCGVRTDGTLVCWGNNVEGQASPPTGTFIQVSAADRFSCAARSNGQVECWGRDDTGRLTPPFQGSPIVQLTSGDSHNCGLRADGAVQCSGTDGFAQASAPDGDFLQIDGGGFHTCGIRPDNTVTCWGSNLDGQSSPPEGKFNKVSAGTWHTCGIRSSGKLECWGGDSQGQSSPPSTLNAIALSAGQRHGCAIASDGKVSCWGANDDGESSPPSGTFAQISVGQFHSCGIQDNGALACWGYDGLGRATPPPGNFIRLASGARHNCGVRIDGAVICWGDDRSGQSTPPAEKFQDVSAGFIHSCGLRADGSVTCWGFNGSGYVIVPAGVTAKTGLFQAPSLNISATRLLNVSTLGSTVGRGLEAGFIVQGDSQRFVVMGENFGSMVDPQLRLLNLSTGALIEQNQNWRQHATAAEVENTLRKPAGDNDAAFAITLPQGLYVAELTDANGPGDDGLVSVTATDSSRFRTTYPLNISTRGPSPMAAGFIAFGTESRCYVIKAEGPILGNGTGTVSDPALLVYGYDSSSEQLELVDANDDWGDHPSANLIAQTFPPSDGKEAALALRLPQGIYVAELYSTRSSEKGQDSIVSVTELPESLLDQGNCDLTRTAAIPPVLDDGPPRPDDPNSPPAKQSLTAFISQPQNNSSFVAGEFIVVKAIAKAEPESASIDYDWDFGNGAHVTMNSNRTATVRYLSTGNKTINLTTRANGLTESTALTLTIRAAESGGK